MRSIISIIVFQARAYYWNYDNYLLLVLIQLEIMVLTHHYNNYGFPNLLYTLLFFQHIISIMTIMVKKIIAIIRIIGIKAIIYMYPLPAHLSGIWLQILGLTGRMHSYTSEAAIEAKILRNPGGQCTSVLAGTPKKQAFSTVFDPRSSTSGTLQSRIFGQMFILQMHC